MTAGVITVSDKGARGEREDVSGAEVQRLLSEISATVSAYDIVPDEQDIIQSILIDYCDNRNIDIIVTTGGTGVSPRDVTPDATLNVIEKEIPGMAEAMRRESSKKTPHGMISRAVVGIRKQSLIINLPGSPRGARENFSVILPALRHAVEKIKGDESDCAV
ncbi:MAG: MogA/MoaB family molybdenum cofactor biosynthesis protein [Deltaproteobacteria bacterium]|nr:MogA/MoaB family molybdenum cofactor biosynthesis protein [Deltaproteobacteria bacterium]MBN2845257.1 MogA/MoaB family molybdenum cofactor biosynthesis protein [Deltaproteobacteria bacterium]